jgi:bifunctional DNA-binding transcriptional regulator/antitoxin component of YhaV-PrlF toxin-antitoxin module
MDYFHGFVSIQSRGTVALPPALRRRYHLDEAGAQVEILERGDGVFELRPVLAVPATQAWFWTPEWQQKEQEAEDDVVAGRVLEFADVDRFLAHLGEPDTSGSSPTSRKVPARRRRVTP